MVGEGPVGEGAPRVVVLEEGDSSGGPHPHHARRTALVVDQTPIFRSTDSLLQNTLSRKIKSRCGTARSIYPVDYSLPMAVLVVAEDTILIIA